jgi:CBS domain-containing protein
MKIANYATRDVVKVSPTNSIDTAISLMEERNIHHLVVASDDSVVGMLSDRDILISTGWMLSVERQVARPGSYGKSVAGPTQVGQIMSQPAVTLTTAHSTHDAAALMLEQHIGAVPILDGGHLVGLITETDLVKWPPLTEIEVDQLLDRDVRELMRAQVASVTPDAPLSALVRLFRERRIRHAPVVLNGILVGIISDRDVRRALGWGSVRDMQSAREGRWHEAEAPATAADIMKESVLTTGPFASLRNALRLMLDRRIHSLPVVEAESLVGIITQTDFIRAFMRQEVR